MTANISGRGFAAYHKKTTNRGYQNDKKTHEKTVDVTCD
jgi:hypothetical protein